MGTPEAPQAATGEVPDVERVLEALRLRAGWLYLIDWDVERGWWAARHDLRGRMLTAGSPFELQALISADYAADPVRDTVPQTACADAVVRAGTKGTGLKRDGGGRAWRWPAPPRLPVGGAA